MRELVEKTFRVWNWMEHAAFDQGLAQQLADHLKAPCYSLSDLKAESLYNTVRDEMAKPVKK
jgi:magnesium chelatase subunit D